MSEIENSALYCIRAAENNQRAAAAKFAAHSFVLQTAIYFRKSGAS